MLRTPWIWGAMEIIRASLRFYGEEGEQPTLGKTR